MEKAAVYAKNNNYDYGTLEENYNCNNDFTINALYYDIYNKCK